MSVELISVLIAVLAVGATLGGLILTGNRGVVGMVVAPLLVTALLTACAEQPASSPVERHTQSLQISIGSLLIA